MKNLTFLLICITCLTFTACDNIDKGKRRDILSSRGEVISEIWSSSASIYIVKTNKNNLLHVRMKENGEITDIHKFHIGSDEK